MLDASPLSHGPLPHGPLGERTIHLCIDMQLLFAERTPWHTPWMERVLPVVARIAEAHPEQTVFTRFIPPRHPDELPGTWRRYYRRWAEMTLDRIDPGLLELVPPLERFVPPAVTVDKRVYSPFSEPAIWRVLRERHANALVITGAETDVCVLATVLDAVDHGFRVVLATDAICSSSDRTHDALMTLYRNRFSEQIETAAGEAIIGAWP
ncbi:MAG: cysteine hydrolase [Alphaproteobacteria bacterium]